MIIHNAQDYLKIISGQRTVWTRVSRNGDTGKISITGRFVCSFVRKTILVQHLAEQTTFVNAPSADRA